MKTWVYHQQFLFLDWCSTHPHGSERHLNLDFPHSYCSVVLNYPLWSLSSRGPRKCCDMGWAFRAFVTLVLHLFGVKTAWDLSFRCFVSPLMAWAKFLCLLVILFSLSVQLLQISSFWLSWVCSSSFEWNHVYHAVQQLAREFPFLLLLFPGVHVHVSFTPLQHFGLSSSQDSKALPPSQNSYFTWLQEVEDSFWFPHRFNLN